MIDLLPSGSAGRRAGWWPPGVHQTLVVLVETLFYWSTVARGCETNSFAVVEMTFICNGLLMFCTKSSIPPSNAFDMIRREQNVFDTREWLTLLFELTIEHDHHIIINIYTQPIQSTFSDIIMTVTYNLINIKNYSATSGEILRFNVSVVDF